MTGRLVKVEQRILAKNDEVAARLRRRFTDAGVFAVSLASSPGAGKTTLLEATLRRLTPGFRAGVVVGDLATDNDARRLAVGAGPVYQVNTGTVCHLEAAMVEAAVADWDLNALDFLFIENVGNLVCPAAFDLGEAARVVLFAVTEGEDKPAKYPPILQTADLVLLTKYDLAGVTGFSEAAFRRALGQVRPGLPVLAVSARTGVGLDGWVGWLRAGLDRVRSRAR